MTLPNMMGSEHVTRALPRTAALSSGARNFKHRAFSRVNPLASLWSYADSSASIVANVWIVKTLRALAAEDDSHGADRKFAIARTRSEGFVGALWQYFSPGRAPYACVAPARSDVRSASE